MIKDVQFKYSHYEIFFLYMNITNKIVPSSSKYLSINNTNKKTSNTLFKFYQCSISFVLPKLEYIVLIFTHILNFRNRSFIHE